MLQDPISVTLDGSSYSLPRTGISNTSGEYTSPDGTLNLRVMQQPGKGTLRTAVSIRHSKIAADPLTAVNQRLNSVVSLSVTQPLTGYTSSELTDLADALIKMLSASSYSTLAKALGGEK